MLTFLATAHAPGMLQVDEQIGVCFFCDAADELEECATVAEKRTKLVSVLKQVWAVEVGPYVALHCVGERVRLDKVKEAWDAMVDRISGDASGDPAPAPTVTAQPSTQGSAAGGSQSTKVLVAAGVDWNDPEAVIRHIGTHGGSILVQAIAKNPALQDNDAVIKAAVAKAPGTALPFAPPRLQDDKQLVKFAVTKVGSALESASKRLQNDREVVLAAVKQNGSALRYANEGLRNDRDFVLAAVKLNGHALSGASQGLRNDREVVLAAVKQNGCALHFASEELRRDRSFVLELVKQRRLLQQNKHLGRDREHPLHYADARAVESWLGLEPSGNGCTLWKPGVKDLCRRAGIPFDHRDKVKELWERICAKLEDLQDARLKRDRSSGAQSNPDDPKRRHGGEEEEGEEA